MVRSQAPRIISLLAVALAAAGISYLIQANVFDGSSESRARFVEAQGDAEWKQLIANAKATQAAEAPWPTPIIQPDVQVITSCRALPADVVGTQMSLEYSPDGTRRRTVEYFVNPETGIRLALILQSDQNLADCDDGRKIALLGDDQRKREIDQHICDQMKLMAAGIEKTDPTLRDASPEVAREYLKTFCE